MPALRHVEQPRPNRDLARQIEAVTGRSRQRTVQVRLPGLHNLENRPRRFSLQNQLIGIFLRLRKDRPKALVTSRQIPQRLTKRLNVDIALKPKHKGNVIGRACSLQAMEEPLAPLRKRQRNNIGTGHRTRGPTRRLRFVQALGQLRHAWRLKKRPYGNLVPKRRADAADQPRRQKEWPPRSKKRSSVPTWSSPSNSANRPVRISSCGVRGAGCSPA